MFKSLTWDSWLECKEVGFISDLSTSSICFHTLVTNKTDAWSEMFLKRTLGLEFSGDPLYFTRTLR